VIDLVAGSGDWQRHADIVAPILREAAARQMGMR
jgi:hypothetical protein